MAGTVLAVAVAAAVAAPGGPAGAAGRAVGTAGTGSRPGPPPAAAGGTQATVTLVTGDKVVVSTDVRGRRSMDIRPAPGRGQLPFVERVSRSGDLTVVPADAERLIAAGRLDSRLFDVTTLIEEGYADRAGKTLPLIVTHREGAAARADLRSSVDSAGARIATDLASIDGAAVRVPVSEADRFWGELTTGPGSRSASGPTFDPGIEKVWLDGQVRASLDESVPQIGAPEAWAAGYTGAGVKVAVLDTGIDASHPDLADAVIAAEDFTESGTTQDGYGHGTHVASIITGSGEASTGKYKGAAPDAGLLVGKVLDDGGFGTDSGIIAGMEWAAAQGARIISLSLGGCPTDGTDPMSQAVDSLTESSGALFTIAAGNHPHGGECAEPQHFVSSPAAADQALAVGSVTKQDALSTFSNVGPRVGDGAVKPEITAPGQDIVAARATGTELGDIVDEQYVRLSGTSMATPHVAGAAALLAQQHPTWKAAQLRSALMGTAAPNPELTAFQQGAGRVDVARAIQQQVLTTPAALSLGTARWPHDDDQPITSKVTYTNTADELVTLDLALSANGPDGAPAPDGMFAVTPDTITVPAGGSGQVTVTSHPELDGPEGAYSGMLTARRAGEQVANTPLGLIREAESYDLTIDTRNRAGQRAEAVVGVTNMAAGPPRLVTVAGEPVTLRLPKGRYDLMTSIFDLADGEGPNQATLAARPDIVLDKDTKVVLDARKGKRVRVQLDSPTAKAQGRQATWVDNGLFGYRVWGGDDPNSAADLYATPTKQVQAYPYAFGYLAALTEPEPASGAAPGQVLRGYHLSEERPGRIPDPPTLTVHDADLAEVAMRFHTQGVVEPQVASLRSTPFHELWPAMPYGYDVTVPSRRIAFYSGRSDLTWDHSLEGVGGGEVSAPGKEYAGGERYAENWNTAAIGASGRPVLLRRRAVPEPDAVLAVGGGAPVLLRRHGCHGADHAAAQRRGDRAKQPGRRRAVRRPRRTRGLRGDDQRQQGRRVGETGNEGDGDLEVHRRTLRGLRWRRPARRPGEWGVRPA